MAKGTDYIEVICAIIIHDNKVLVAQRSMHMKLPLKWEFPGGKKEKNETDEECLQREILEELNIQINVHNLFAVNEHQYADMNILLKAYHATFETGTILMIEHKTVKWLPGHLLNKLDWAEADIPIVKKIIESNKLIP